MRKGNLLEPGDQIVVNDVTYTVTGKEIVHRSTVGYRSEHPGAQGRARCRS